MDCRICRCGCCNRSLSRPEPPHWLSVSSRRCSPRRPLSWLCRSRSQRSRHRRRPLGPIGAPRPGLAKARAELSTGVVTLLNARADLVAYGAAPQHLAELTALDAGLTRIARSSALAAGVGAGLAVVCAGGAVWGALPLARRRYVMAR